MRKILISINPEHVAKILSGEKKFEYRTKAAKQDVDSLIIYETTPVKRIVAEAKILEVLELTPEALDEYVSLCATLGRSVTFKKGERTLSGAAVGVTSAGELRVMLSDGTVRTLNSGEVTVQGIY